jgi:hypothetical protein
VYGHGTLAQLIEEAFSRGVHRVPVYNRASTVVTNIISQSGTTHTRDTRDTYDTHDTHATHASAHARLWATTNETTRADIIKFIMGKMDEAGNPEAVLGSLMGKTVDELRLGTKPVISMSDELPAFKALQLVRGPHTLSFVQFSRPRPTERLMAEQMVRNRVSAVAVVDKVGQLMADFSATEVRGLSVDNFPYANTTQKHHTHHRTRTRTTAHARNK